MGFFRGVPVGVPLGIVLLISHKLLVMESNQAPSAPDSNENAVKRPYPLSTVVELLREGKSEQAADFIIDSERANLPDGHGGKGIIGVAIGETVSQFSHFESYKEYVRERTDFIAIMMESEHSLDAFHNAVIRYFNEERPHDMGHFTKFLQKLKNETANPSLSSDI
jgi:hypothetical protein